MRRGLGHQPSDGSGALNGRTGNPGEHDGGGSDEAVWGGLRERGFAMSGESVWWGGACTRVRMRRNTMMELCRRNGLVIHLWRWEEEEWVENLSSQATHVTLNRAAGAAEASLVSLLVRLLARWLQGECGAVIKTLLR